MASWMVGTRLEFSYLQMNQAKVEFSLRCSIYFAPPDGDTRY